MINNNYIIIRNILIFVILILVFGSELSYSSDKDFQVLLPDKKIGRKTKVLANQVIIRIKKEYIQNSNVESILKSIDKSIKIDNSLLKPSESITFNVNLRAKTLLKPNQNIGKIIKSEEPLLRTFVVKYDGNQSPEDFCKELLKKTPALEIAEPIILPELQYEPNDPMRFSQTLLDTCKLYDAWDIEQGDTNVIIGISDNGVNQEHEDLKNSIACNWNDPVNGIDDDGNGYTDDFAGYDLTGENLPPDNTYNSDSHGTSVAGIASATTDNEAGICGTAFKCRFFPIKIEAGGELIKAYESIYYAAKRGFKVVNCSWGIVKPYSEIDQSAFNYAVANDVAVVASGGNDMGSLENNYPSAYDGVLAVGEVNQSDIFSGNNIGAYLDVLAPGTRNWAPDNSNGSTGYGNSETGSSFSSPVVTGILALIRSKYPYLSALQSIELARQSVDDVSQLPGNVFWKDILPGRINAYKAVTTEPFSIPSVRPLKAVYKSKEGTESTRFSVGDTVLMSIDAFNYLGDANNLTFDLSAVWDETGSIQVVDSLVSIPSVQRESNLTIEEYKFVIKKENREKMFFRCDIYGQNNYHDFFLIEFIPSPIVTTFKNDAISFSVSDRGTIGFGGTENSKQGVGFVYNDKGNQLWKACFIASDSNKKTVTSLNWDQNSFDDNDFSYIKAFVPPENNIGIFNDNNAYKLDKLGIEVKQEFILPEGEQTVAKVNIEITNTSTEDIVDFTSGYYFDWDIYDSDSNSVELLTEAVPDGLDENQAAAEMMSFTDNTYPVFGNAAISYETSAIVQLAGFKRIINNIEKIYDDNERTVIINSGTDIQDVGVFDAAIFSGMKYLGIFAPGEKRKYSICFGGAENKEEFIQKMKVALDSTYTSVNDEGEEYFSVKIYPQPAQDYLYCQIETYSTIDLNIKIYDIMGREVYSTNKYIDGIGNLCFPVNLSQFVSGTYLLTIKSGNIYKTYPITVIR
ncbi:MAG: S8/S53 family peptidase [bacterium]